MGTVTQSPSLRVLHYLLCHSEGEIVAHCLDLDLVAAGENASKAVERLNLLVQAQIEKALTTGNYQNLSTPAPQEYWDRFMEPEPKLDKWSLDVSGPPILAFPKAHIGVLAAQCA